MNGHCSTCDVEKECGYPYKPCDCCNYRKFKPLPSPTQYAPRYTDDVIPITDAIRGQK